MATDALEEKILKIRQQNEEIRRRHEVITKIYYDVVNFFIDF